MMRAVLDSNVYISALLLGGNPQRVLDCAAAGFIDLYISDSISNEVERVLAVKFHWSKERLAKATDYLFASAQ